MYNPSWTLGPEFSSHSQNKNFNVLSSTLQSFTVLWCFLHVCLVQVTILKLVWRSRRSDVPRCAHFPTDICSLIKEGEITLEKCTHRGASAHRERHTLSLGRNKHGHNNSAPVGDDSSYIYRIFLNFACFHF